MNGLAIEKNSSDNATSKKQAMNSVINKKRGLLDVLDVHACAGSEIGCTGRKIKSAGSKDGIPYEPSLVSMPRSISSEESVDLNQIPQCQSKVVKQVEFGTALGEPVKDLAGESDYSALVDNHRGIKSTLLNSRNQSWKRVSKEFSILSDIIPEQSNESLLNVNELPLFGNRSTLSRNPSVVSSSVNIAELSECGQTAVACPLMKTKKLKNLLKCSEGDFTPIELGNVNDSKNSPYTSHKPSTYKKTEKISDCSRKTAENLKNSICRHSEKTVLSLYDCNKFPLTDKEGNVLCTANDQALVVFKNGKPKYDCFKRLVFDKNGESSLSKNFKPYTKMSRTSSVVSEIPLFDFRGFPLTNSDGSSLINACGNALVDTDEDKKILGDINKNPIFDKLGIPVTKKAGCWLTPKGFPYRVFDKDKYPLTDKQGVPLCDVNGVNLVICDKFGRPVIAYNGESVYDINGVSSSDPNFNPAISHETECDDIIAFLERTPTQLFNEQGFPLTGRDGMILKNAAGEYLLDMSNSISQYAMIKIGNYTILNCTLKNHSIQSNSAIDEHLVEDGTTFWPGRITYGCPILDKNHKYVYNKTGKQIFFSLSTSVLDTKNSKLKSSTIGSTSSETYSLNLYSTGETILNTNSDSSISEISLEKLNISFETEFDIFGRPLYDSSNRPLFDKYGRPMFDLFMTPIYDSEGKPIYDSENNLLINKLDSLKRNLENDYFNIFHIQTLKMISENADLNGGPMFDKFGNPMYNKFGKPLKDAFGRPLYDGNGKPLCDENGLPASEQIKLTGLRIIKVEDKFQRLAVYPEDERQDPNMSLGKLLQQNVQHYNSRVRITTFAGGEQVLELLEVAPALEETEL